MYLSCLGWFLTTLVWFFKHQHDVDMCVIEYNFIWMDWKFGKCIYFAFRMKSENFSDRITFDVGFITKNLQN